MKLEKIRELIKITKPIFNNNGIAKNVILSTFNSSNLIIDINNIKIWPTITAKGAMSKFLIYNKGNIRYSTAKEHFAIQGFNSDFKNIDKVSDYKLRFLMGNSISIFALKKHFENIKPKTIGVVFAGIDTVGEFFGREKIVDYIEKENWIVGAHNKLYDTNYKSRDILKTDFMFGELLHFSPPCVNFSTQGKNSKIDEFSTQIIKIIKNSKPKYVSVENVLGYKNVMEQIKEFLKVDYEIEIRKIIPYNQSRKRLFLIGILKK